MSYTLVMSPRAMADLQKIKKSGDKANLRKLKKIFEELCEHPLTGIGNPEQLRYRENTYSRRLSKKVLNGDSPNEIEIANVRQR